MVAFKNSGCWTTFGCWPFSRPEASSNTQQGSEKATKLPAAHTHPRCWSTMSKWPTKQHSRSRLKTHLQSFTGGTYAAALPTDERLFAFAFSRVQPTQTELAEDKHADDVAIWNMRDQLQATYMTRTRPVRPMTVIDQVIQTPAKTRSAASTSAARRNVREIGHMLDVDAQDRLDPDWLEIQPDQQRGASVASVMGLRQVRAAWNVVTMAIYRPKHAAAVLATKSLATEKHLGPEEAIEVAVVSFLTLYRRELRKRLKCPPDEDGWGACFAHGSHQIANPEGTDTENHKPDVPIFSRRPCAPGIKYVKWADVVAVIEIKAHRSDDLSSDLAKQLFRYVRSIKAAHPICPTVHVATICGPIVRLWTFGPGSFTTSRGYDFGKAQDELAIASVFAFLVAAKPQHLIGHWSPPSTFTVVRGQRTHTWTWTDGPKVIYVRPEMFGSLTCVFGGKATCADASAYRDSGTKFREGDTTMLKCLLLPPHLVEHEPKMYGVLSDMPGGCVPNLLGIVQTEAASLPPSQQALSPPTGGGGFAVAPLCQGDDPITELRFHAFAFQHRRGRDIPAKMSEQSLVSLMEQLVERLLQLSDRGAHYRDLNTGNVLFEDVDGKPKLVLCDYGNVRMAFHQRGVDSPTTVKVEGSSASDNVGRLRLIHAIARDDARSANSAFLPSSAYYINKTMRDLKEIGMTSPDELDDEDALMLRMYAHTYLDDVESVCYLGLYWGAQRSFVWDDWRTRRADNFLHNLGSKEPAWRRRAWWSKSMTMHCPVMSAEWQEMMCELRDVIYDAQKARLERLRLLLGTRAASMPILDEERTLQKPEILCFESCLAILGNYKERVRSTEYSAADQHPRQSRERQREAVVPAAARDAQEVQLSASPSLARQTTPPAKVTPPATPLSDDLAKMTLGSGAGGDSPAPGEGLSSSPLRTSPQKLFSGLKTVASKVVRKSSRLVKQRERHKDEDPFG